MSFLQQFFRDVFEQSIGAVATTQKTPTDVQSHFEVSRYGDFELTDAVRPSMDLQIKPSEGFRHEVYVDDETKMEVPVLMAAVSREKLFPLFMEMVQQLGDSVDVVLETSHDHAVSGHVDLYREHIDMPVLTSILWEYEDLLTNDGCTGIAVLNPNIPQEIQFDEHKLLIMYGEPLRGFEDMMNAVGVTNDPSIRFITEAEHVHSSTQKYQTEFEDLRLRLGTCLEKEEGEESPEDEDFEGAW